MNRADYAEKVLFDWDKNPEVRAAFNDNLKEYWRHMKNEKIRAEYERIDTEARAAWRASPEIRSKFRTMNTNLAHKKATFAREFNS